MEQLLQEWCDFCEGRKQFDKSHFHTLFHEVYGDASFRQILQYFPHTEELMRRVKNVRQRYPENKDRWEINPERVIKLAIDDLKEKRKSCVAFHEDELLEIIDNVQPRFVTNSDAVWQSKYQNWPHSDLIITFGDYLDTYWLSTEDKYYAIFESFYGFVTSSQIQWYLASPLIAANVNLDYYFDLWSIGGDYALTEKELLVTQKTCKLLG